MVWIQKSIVKLESGREALKPSKSKARRNESPRRHRKPQARENAWGFLLTIGISFDTTKE
jgi:hypothetical protein